GGNVVRELLLPGADGSMLRLARLRPGGDRVLLAFGVWRPQLKAYDPSGKELWAYPGARSVAIDDVWAADLDGDGLDETIIGYNAGAGVDVVDNEGKLLWKSTAIGDVWHVHAGAALGDGHRQVVTSSAAGNVHVFGRDGRQFADRDAGCYAGM